MSDPSTEQAGQEIPQPADGHRGFRLLALAAVTAGVLLLAAAAFVLSYAGIHAVALSAGVSPRLARIYPLLLDAMLVVACAAVLSLRGAGLPSRSFAWLSMLALLAAAAAADALHATGTRLPRRPAAAGAAVIPWLLVLIGFGLLLAMLRQARLRRAAAAAQPEAAREPSGHAEARRQTSDRPVPRESPGAAGPPVPALAAAGYDTGLPADVADDLAIDTNPGPDDPATDEAAPGDPPETARTPRAPREQPAPAGAEPEPGDTESSGPGREADPDAEPGPVSWTSPEFDRMRSSPTPPGS